MILLVLSALALFVTRSYTRGVQAIIQDVLLEIYNMIVKPSLITTNLKKLVIVKTYFWLIAGLIGWLLGGRIAGLIGTLIGWLLDKTLEKHNKVNKNALFKVV